MEQKLYQVKLGRNIFHGGIQYFHPDRLWLVDQVAAVHAENIEEVQPEEGEVPPDLEAEQTETPPEVEEAIAILDEVAKPTKKDAPK